MSRPDLPLVLPDDRRRLNELARQLEGWTTVDIGDLPEDAAPALCQVYDHRWRQANRPLALYAEEIGKLQRERSSRLKRLVRRLRALFRAYDCEIGGWRLLAVRLAGATGGLPLLASRSREMLDAGELAESSWRRTALELAMKAGHFTVASAAYEPGARKGDEHLYFDLRMEALLTENPQTGRSACRSIAEAARRVHRELTAAVGEHRDSGGTIADPPAAAAIEKDYHRRLRRRRHEAESGMYRIPGFLKQELVEQSALADLEKAAGIAQQHGGGPL